MSNTKDYYIGFDLGTNSVGWAVTDKNYKLLRKKGKDLWGVREFDSAKGAIDRRTNRVSRRRRLREVARIGMLNSFFADEIAKVDKEFLQRLKESKYYLEDKKVESKYTLFADKDYTDKDYFKEYPTIFHLRKSLLLEENKKFDIRFIYLAILNMFKHRGHFLNDIAGDGAEDSIDNLYTELIEKTSFIDDENQFKYLEDVSVLYFDKSLKKQEALDYLSELLGIRKNKDKKHYEILKSLVGMKFELKTIFSLEDSKKISFRENIEENFSDILSGEQIELLELMNKIHDNIYLSSIMKSHKYLSLARVEDYEKHKKDLEILKKYIKENVPEKYDSIFRVMEKGSYSAYVGSVNSDKGKVRRGVKDSSGEELINNIKKILKNLEDSKEKAYILEEIEKESFLPKQLTTANGVIPNQVHLIEMKKILSNAEKHYKFLLEKDESGLTLTERILQLFSFHIPYYVGPLINAENNNGWVVRKEKGKVLPWNFEDKIDVKKTAEKFIENLIGCCTYLRNEKVLPKNSLMYEKFMVLNELNSLKIDGRKISPQLKQDIYNDLFTSGKRVTGNQLKRYLIGKGLIKSNEFDRVSGIDIDFKNYLSSYNKFLSVFGEDIDKYTDIIENIIFWGTVYGDDKKFYIETVVENYGDILTKEQIDRIKGFKFKDWGRLSKEFLQIQGCFKEDGEILPLIDMMWERNENLMELLSDRYTYLDAVKNRTDEVLKTLTTFEYEDLEDMYLSAPVKRMIWQSILILKEIVSVMGCEPKRVFVEMTRSEAEKKKTESRKKQLVALYNAIKKDPDIKSLKESLDKYDDKSLRQKKLYLYYTQKGRCMYTGDIIDIDELFNKNLYDIDHIYPRHFVKDDSIHNNLVLVKKEKNAHKSDKYPIEQDIYSKNIDFWRYLKDCKLITEEKYRRLTNRNPFTDEQLAGFINRQIVETGQATKAISHIFESILKDSKVVYVKSGLVSDFRHKFEMYKVRIVNDFHHAQDAYLNIVAGNVYYVKFTNNTYNFIKNYKKNPDDNRYHMDKVFDFNVARNDDVAWVVDGENKTEYTVKSVMSKTTPIITRRAFEEKGELFNATIYSKNKVKDNVYIPIKESDERLRDIHKYGGFTSVNGTYFFLVEHEVKNEKVRTLEHMPLYLENKVSKNNETLENYCINVLGLKNPSIRLRKIRIQSLVKLNGYYGILSGRTGNSIIVRNAVSMCLSSDLLKYIKKIENISVRQYVSDDITVEKNIELYEVIMDKHKNTIFKNRPNPMGKNLEDYFDKFKSISKEEQAQVLNEILKLSCIGPTKANLELIGGSSNSGIMTINKKISNLTECILIHQSPTGLFEKRVDLLKV